LELFATVQELLDVTRKLLADMDRERESTAQPGDPYGAPNLELKLDADQDELREKFGIVRVSHIKQHIHSM
jgi:hypothetical protein